MRKNIVEIVEMKADEFFRNHGEAPNYLLMDEVSYSYFCSVFIGSPDSGSGSLLLDQFHAGAGLLDIVVVPGLWESYIEVSSKDKLKMIGD